MMVEMQQVAKPGKALHHLTHENLRPKYHQTKQARTQEHYNTQVCLKQI